MSRAAVLRLAVGAFAAGYAALSVLRHLAFETGRFDLGNMTQAVWSTAQGRPLEATSLSGAQFVRLGAHFDPILALFAPLWLAWPDPSLLLVVQAAAVALGALPVFWLARKHVGHEGAALGLALGYLLSPALGWMTLSEFHPAALATPLLLFAFWYLDEGRLLPLALVLALALATKEHVGLAVAGMGLWHALARRRPLPGLAVAGAGVAVSVLALAVVVPHFSPEGTSSFYGRYEEVGGSPGGIVRTAVTDPGAIAAALGERRDATYLLQLLLPVAGLALLAPLPLLAGAPELLLNLLSETRTQTSIHYHYSATVLAALAVASVLGAARVARRWAGRAPHAGALAAAAALAGSYALGPLPVWSALPGGETLAAGTTTVTAHDRVAARAVALVPHRAAVSASNSLGAHLSERRRVLSFPRLLDATWVAVDETSPGYLDRIAPRPYARAVARLRRNPEWRLVFEEDGVLLFRRR